MFLEEGKIVSTKGRNTPEKTWNAKKPDTYAGFPMAVLVNRYSGLRQRNRERGRCKTTAAR